MESKPVNTERSMDFDKFTRTVSALLDTVWGKNWGKFSMIKPTISDSRDIPMPQIVYSLKDFQPGLVGENRREISPRQREISKGPSNLTGEEITVQIMGQMMDCTIEFFVYADNNREALELAKNLRIVLDKYKGILMGEGMQNMWFQKDYERNNQENADDKLSSRGLVYLVRLEELFRIESDEIKEVHLRLKVAMNETELTGDLPSKDGTDTEIITTRITKKDNNLLL